MHKKKATALLVSTGVAGVLAGGVLMGTMSANAAGSSSSTSPSGSSSSTSAPGTSTPGQPPTNGNTDPTKPMRSDEHLLTGDTLAKVTAAVKAKYPNATFQRVETDSDGVYEAHILVAGKPVTVEVGKSFTVTGTEAAPTGTGVPGGGGVPGGRA